jgi:hypothetical protein
MDQDTMGYYSYLCKHCGHSIASHDCLGRDSEGNRQTHWLMECVLLDGYSAVVGTYDGFGHVISEHGGEMDIADMRTAPLMLHKACWLELHRPTGDAFESGSKHDPHQGYPPETVWNLSEPPRYKWELLKRFGDRKYFLDTLSKRISMVGDSGPTPDRGDDGVLWINPDGVIRHDDGLWRIPVVAATTNKHYWIGADTKEEVRWVADKHDMLMVGG